MPVLTGIWMEAGEVRGDSQGSSLEPRCELISFPFLPCASPGSLCPPPSQGPGSLVTQVHARLPSGLSCRRAVSPVHAGRPAGRAGQRQRQTAPHADLCGPRVHRGRSAGCRGCLGATWRGAPPSAPSGKAPSLSAGEMSFTAFAEGVGLESNFIKRFILCHLLLPRVWLTVPLRRGQTRLQEGPGLLGAPELTSPTGAPGCVRPSPPPMQAHASGLPPPPLHSRACKGGPGGVGGEAPALGGPMAPSQGSAPVLVLLDSAHRSEPGQRLAKVGGRMAGPLLHLSSKAWPPAVEAGLAPHGHGGPPPEPHTGWGAAGGGRPVVAQSGEQVAQNGPSCFSLPTPPSAGRLLLPGSLP